MALVTRGNPFLEKALVAAIDLFGDHLPQSGLISARKKIVTALGHDPSEEGLEIAASGGDDSPAEPVTTPQITTPGESATEEDLAVDLFV